jgi:hypothetical protein
MGLLRTVRVWVSRMVRSVHITLIDGSKEVEGVEGVRGGVGLAQLPALARWLSELWPELIA